MKVETLWLDVTTIMSWQTTPVGIVRMEMELANYYLKARSQCSIKFANYNFILRKYKEVPAVLLEKHLEKLSDLNFSLNTIQNKKQNQLYLDIRTIYRAVIPAKARKFINDKLLRRAKKVLMNLYVTHDTKEVVFQNDEKLLIAGPAWLYPRLLDLLTQVKKQVGLKVYNVVYDLIPIKFPYLTLPNAARSQEKFYDRGMSLIDHFLCISKCTETDFKTYAATKQRQISTVVVSLGTNLCQTDLSLNDEEILQRLKIDRPFLLFVSTLEARKNHMILYQAYQLLIEDGHTDLPLMVWVGKKGWRTDDFMEQLELNLSIKPYIKIYESVGDAELSALYRSCLYTVYPSLYEGWGLPVVESLTHHKYCLCSNAGSLPEAGLNFVKYLSPYDTRAWANAIIELQSRHHLEQVTQKIATEYHPLTWQEAGAKLADQIESHP